MGPHLLYVHCRNRVVRLRHWETQVAQFEMTESLSPFLTPVVIRVSFNASRVNKMACFNSHYKKKPLLLSSTQRLND